MVGDKRALELTPLRGGASVMVMLCWTNLGNNMKFAIKGSGFLFILGLGLFLTGCSFASKTRSETCADGKTLIDDVCVDQEMANFISCVRSQSLDLGTERTASFNASIKYFDIGAQGGKDAIEKMHKKYSASDANMATIIQKCAELAGLNANNNGGSYYNANAREIKESDSTTTHRQAPSFQNDYFAVIIKSAYLSDDKKTLSLELEFQNLLNEKLYIGAERDVHRVKLNMTSDHGELLSLARNGLMGLSTIWSSVTQKEKISNYTEISANSQTTAIFRFESYARKYPHPPQQIEGKVFSFNGQLFRYMNDRSPRVSVGISDIKIK